MTQAREWDVFAEETGDPALPFNTITDWEEVLAMSGVPQAKRISARLIEDPEGDLRGWVPTGKTMVEMVQHHRVFPIQFTYGVEAELERGNGEVVPLRIEKVSNLH